MDQIAQLVASIFRVRLVPSNGLWLCLAWIFKVVASIVVKTMLDIQLERWVSGGHSDSIWRWSGLQWLMG